MGAIHPKKRLPRACGVAHPAFVAAAPDPRLRTPGQEEASILPTCPFPAHRAPGWRACPDIGDILYHG
jgi:hypothetical protein